MKVGLKPGTEKRGLLGGKEVHTVNITVTMSDEEKAAAQAAGLMKHEMFQVPHDAKRGDGPTYLVQDLAKGLNVKGEFPNFIVATEFTQEVKSQLVALKSALEAKMASGEEEFEL